MLMVESRWWVYAVLVRLGLSLKFFHLCCIWKTPDQKKTQYDLKSQLHSPTAFTRNKADVLVLIWFLIFLNPQGEQDTKMSHTQFLPLRSSQTGEDWYENGDLHQRELSVESLVHGCAGGTSSATTVPAKGHSWSILYLLTFPTFPILCTGPVGINPWI